MICNRSSSCAAVHMSMAKHAIRKTVNLNSPHFVSSGGAALPAFGMAVLKSPPPSRSPSAEKNHLVPPHLPATATNPAATAAASAPPAATTAAAVAGLGCSAGAADAAASGSALQPSGCKRKRNGAAGVPEMDLPSGSKQARQKPALAEQREEQQGPTAPTFHLLRSHK